MLDTKDLRRRLAADGADVVIIYDGQCVFCQSYVRFVRLREACGTVSLLDARSDGLAALVHAELGLDLDEGMLVLIGEQGYYGAAAMQILSAMSSRSGLLNRLTAWVFSKPRLARLLYPLLKAGRAATLFLLGRPRLDPAAGGTAGTRGSAA